MKILSALVVLTVAAGVRPAEQVTCDNSIHCPCGSTGGSVKVCPQEVDGNVDRCSRWSKCKTCQDGLDGCLECPDGLEGQLCSTETGPEISSREERQYHNHPPYHQTYPRRPVNNPYRRGPSYPTRPQQQQGIGSCPQLNSPKFGSIRCSYNYRKKTCIGTCIPGYTFEGHGSEDEMTLTCTGGYYTPFNEFPPCKSDGCCDLTVVGTGTFNCTADVGGTLCDIICDGRFVGRYFCYPGHHWEPHLPYCMEPKEVDDVHETCNCEYGGSCDIHGNCVCPVGRTGRFCEKRAQTCKDPGFVHNGLRKNPDETDSSVRLAFNEGESVVYSCKSEEYALRGSPLLSCKDNGMWSSPLPKCIRTPSVRPLTGLLHCPDPGVDPNGSRRPQSPASQRGFLQGSSLVYSCNQGYDLDGERTVYCLTSSKWSSARPTCKPQSPEPANEPAYCLNPGPILDGQVVYYPPINSRRGTQPQTAPDEEEYPYGGRLEYSCDSGYSLDGYISLICQENGEWSEQPPVCTKDGDRVYCLNPGASVPNGGVVYYPPLTRRGGAQPQTTLDDPEYPLGARLEYSCDSGYTLLGYFNLTCNEDGEWSTSPPVCEEDSFVARIDPVYCLNPGPISNGQVVYYPPLNSRQDGQPQALPDEKEYPYGGRLEYSCDSGFNMDGTTSLICQENGEWSEQPPVCTKDVDRVFCLNPGTSVANGQVIYHPPPSSGGGVQPQSTLDDPEHPFGARLEYSCESGYTLHGYFNVTCEEDGDWSSEPAVCIEGIAFRTLPYCPEPGVDPRGIRNPPVGRYTYSHAQGTKMVYSCREGYVLEGEKKISCLRTREYSAPRPKCKHQIGGPDIMYCPFRNISDAIVTNYPPAINGEEVQPLTNLIENEYPNGTRLEYSCREGYILNGSNSLICKSDEQWSAAFPVCLEIARIRDCNNPEPVPNSRVLHIPAPNGGRPRPLDDNEDFIGYPQGSRLTNFCNDGYFLQGASNRTCVEYGQWSPEPPNCYYIGNLSSCINPGPVLNGKIGYYSPVTSPRNESAPVLPETLEYLEGTRLDYECDEGYVNEGSLSMVCESTGMWSDIPPKCLSDCGRRVMENNRPILHAGKTEIGDWPWVVTIGYQLNNSLRLVCGGALLNTKTVITAAHCLDFRTSFNRFILFFGKYYNDSMLDDEDVQVRVSERVILHPEFNTSNWDSDIALIIFSPKIKYSPRVHHICLPTAESTEKNLVAGSKGYVTGWDTTEEQPGTAELLMAHLPFLPNSACMESLLENIPRYTPVLTENMFCAGHPEGNHTTCRGYGGSPLVYYDPITERYTLEGLVSYGVPGKCDLPKRYSVFTKVSGYLPWIYRNLG